MYTRSAIAALSVVNTALLWITRLSAAVRERGLQYSRFIAGLVKANIELDREDAVGNGHPRPGGFDVVFALVKKAIG